MDFKDYNRDTRSELFRAAGRYEWTTKEVVALGAVIVILILVTFVLATQYHITLQG